MPSPRDRCYSTLVRDEGGQISIFAALSAAAFASLLMLVINTGYSSSEKIRLQNTADSVAISGGLWVARGLNVLSLNNVTQTQLLALGAMVPALDRTLETSIRILDLEIQALTATSAVPIFGGAAAIAALILRLERTYLQILRAILRPILIAVQNPSGPLWQAIGILGLLNEAVALGAPALVEAEAQRIAEQNGAEIGLLLGRGDRALIPWPSLPVRRGRPEEICLPTLQGSPARDQKGYHPLLGYAVGEGPLDRYGEATARYLGLDHLSLTTGAMQWFKLYRREELWRRCGGGRAKPFLLGRLGDSKEVIQEQLEFLGIAYRQQKVAWGASRFSSPLKRNRLAYAQVRVTNPTSFDLFTQDWRVELAPASILEDPNGFLLRPREGAEVIAGWLENKDLQEALRLLRRPDVRQAITVLNNH